ncbi:hypothetical protein EVAR_55212_1 [Eumeta japonica]|uniref:Uncharacterized protein n=1 Tax=Eumeta variegata TaxID=151549 RepID=A0A4C1ZQZ0_EUMVA|nr:hypothetical protein EVAR_55212_1 [Eumeta japonica]
MCSAERRQRVGGDGGQFSRSQAFRSELELRRARSAALPSTGSVVAFEFFERDDYLPRYMERPPLSTRNAPDLDRWGTYYFNSRLRKRRRKHKGHDSVCTDIGLREPLSGTQ